MPGIAQSAYRVAAVAMLVATGVYRPFAPRFHTKPSTMLLVSKAKLELAMDKIGLPSKLTTRFAAATFTLVYSWLAVMTCRSKNSNCCAEVKGASRAC